MYELGVYWFEETNVNWRSAQRDITVNLHDKLCFPLKLYDHFDVFSCRSSLVEAAVRYGLSCFLVL